MRHCDWIQASVDVSFWRRFCISGRFVIITAGEGRVGVGKSSWERDMMKMARIIKSQPKPQAHS